MRRLDAVALVLALLVLCSTALAGLLHTQDARRVTTCANNLAQLYKMMHNYTAQYGGADREMPVATGDAFWLYLSTMTPPMIDKSVKDIYQCPVENVDDEGCDYRGPAKNINLSDVGDADPVGADVDGNHGEGKGGNVVRKAGDVLTVAAKDPVWLKAATATTGGNKAVPPKPSVETAKQKQALVDIGKLAIAVMLYYEFNGSKPASLKDLIEKPKDAEFWPDGGYLNGGAVPKDPWGRDYVYKPGDARQPVIKSLGADGKPGGDGENADLDVNDVFKGRGESVARAKEEASRPPHLWAAACLRTLCTAEADFRSNDRDNNRMQDFWTGDVRSLCWMCPSTGGSEPCRAPREVDAMKLIEPALADADAAPLGLGCCAGKAPKTPTPHHGYLFRAMEKDEKGAAYNKSSDSEMEKWRAFAKFGFCAYPAEYKKGMKTLIVGEDITIWVKDTGGKPVSQYPAAPRDEGWEKLD